LLRQTLLRDFDAMYPGRLTNVTNGVSLPRFVTLANPGLARLLDEVLGADWLRHPERLTALDALRADAAFRERWRAVKRGNKRLFSDWIMRRHGVSLDPDTLFDAHCKRIHEYKRQLLNILHVIALWNRIDEGRAGELVPRTVIFSGKAAPGYRTAKLIIALIHAVARVIAADARACPLLRVVFVPDFNVKVAQRIYPAADVSEQLSTAGTEASGTGNMKFTLNGALTIGTLDGANIDIRQAVGADNFFSFGLNADEVDAQRAHGPTPSALTSADPELARALGKIADGTFSSGRRDVFEPLVHSLLSQDTFLVLADFRSYADAQSRVAEAWRDKERWTSASIACVARASHFSAGRAIGEYARHIWHVDPVDIGASADARPALAL
jgi:starch phosphorylase